MHEAFWNGLFDVRWEEAPLGPEAIRLVQRLRERCYAERILPDPPADTPTPQRHMTRRAIARVHIIPSST